MDSLSGFSFGDQLTVSIFFKRTGGQGNYQGIVNTGYYSNGAWEIRMGREGEERCSAVASSQWDTLKHGITSH